MEFNRVAPLKSALRVAAQSQATPTDGQPERPPAAALPVSFQGKLVESNCGASPLTIPPMSAATDPWHLDNKGTIQQIAKCALTSQQDLTTLLPDTMFLFPPVDAVTFLQHGANNAFGNIKLSAIDHVYRSEPEVQIHRQLSTIPPYKWQALILLHMDYG